MGPAEHRRGRARRRVEDEIDDVAERLLGEVGAQGLSPRLVADAMGLSPTALYHYVDSKDDLLTRLITRGFDGLADAMGEAVAAVVDEPPPRRVAAMARGYRSWALEHRHLFGLLYGTPVPGYEAPRAGATDAAAARVGEVVASVLSPPDPVMWTRVHGFVMLEIWGHLHRLAPVDADALFEAETAALMDRAARRDGAGSREP